MKMSSILNFSSKANFSEKAPSTLDYYRVAFRHIYQCFGPDRIVFGSNWPPCEHFGQIEDIINIVNSFLKSKGNDINRKVMQDNLKFVFTRKL